MSPCGICNLSACKQGLKPSDFIPLEPSSWPRLSRFLNSHPHSLTGYTLPCLAAWNGVFDYRWTFPEPETLLISFRAAADGKRHLLQPIGLFSPEIQSALLDCMKKMDYSVQFLGIEPSFLERHSLFLSHFDVCLDRNNCNYIYRSEDLAHLAGRHYSKKRNLIAQASRAYTWTEEPITARNISLCLEVLNELQRELTPGQQEDLKPDDTAVRAAINLFCDLPMDGRLITINQIPVAFSLFEKQTSDTAVIHFERALRRYKGLYQVINQVTAQAIQQQGISWINREEDLGDPGLRQSKESYYPANLASAFSLTLKRTTL